MSGDPARGRGRRRRSLFGRILGIGQTEHLWEGLDGRTDAERLERGRAWVSSASPDERTVGLTILAAVNREEALEPLLKALDDPDKRVRTTAFVNLLWHDPPQGHGERIVVQLGGRMQAAERFVQEPWPPGAIGSLGLTDQMLPHLESIARTGTRRKHRRRAAAYVRILRDHPPGGR